jgi:uncharacterized ion transporter superfamily protein YfcC
MDKLKPPQGLRFFLLLVLLPCVLFSVIDYSASIASDPGTSGSGETALLVSDYYVLYNQPGTQGGTQLNKIWRQCFSFIVMALFLKTVYKIINQKHFIYNYYQNFFHILIISLFLGGQAPPHSSY